MKHLDVYSSEYRVRSLTRGSSSESFGIFLVPASSLSICGADHFASRRAVRHGLRRARPRGSRRGATQRGIQVRVTSTSHPRPVLAPSHARTAPSCLTRRRVLSAEIYRLTFAASLPFPSVSRQAAAPTIQRPHARGTQHRVHRHILPQRHPTRRPRRPVRRAQRMHGAPRPHRRTRRPRDSHRHIPRADHRRGVHALVRVILLLGAGHTAPAGYQTSTGRPRDRPHRGVHRDTRTSDGVCQ